MFVDLLKETTLDFIDFYLLLFYFYFHCLCSYFWGGVVLYHLLSLHLIHSFYIYFYF